MQTKLRKTHWSDNISVLATPAFVVSLALLTVNDWYLKAQYSGWVAGKLSDFSGLIVFSLVVFALLQRHVRALAVLVCVLFVWWKSPYSQGFIDAVNVMGPLHVARTVDYTDLAALVVIPWSVRFFETHARRRSTTRGSRVLAFPIGLAALLAIAGTSMVPYAREFSIQQASEQAVLSYEAVENVLAGVAESDEFECRRSSAGRICEIDSIWFMYSIKDGRAHFRVEDALPMLGSGRRTMRGVDELIEKIKTAFALNFNDLEYVEPLIGRTPRQREAR